MKFTLQFSKTIKKHIHALLFRIKLFFFHLKLKLKSPNTEKRAGDGNGLSHTAIDTGPNGDVTHTQANSSLKSSLQWLLV